MLSTARHGEHPMKKLIMTALVTAQLTTAQPAFAATLGGGPETRVGVFAGAQLRLTLGGSHAEAPRASLGIAPTAQSRRIDGSGRTRIGEGLQLSLEPNRPVELNLAGTRLDRLGLAPNGQAPGGRRSGISPLGWAAIGVGVVAVTVVVLFESCKNGDICGTDNDG
jgi:hypothetical protein